MILAAAVSTATATGSWTVALAAAPALVVRRRQLVAALAVALVVVAAVRTDAAWAGLRPDAPGPYRGWAIVVVDPQVLPGVTRVVVSIEGERYESWVRGRVRSRRPAAWRAGDQVVVSGERRPLDPDRRRRLAAQHIVGELEADWFGDVRAGGPASTASNRVRELIARGADHLPTDLAALTRGLVIGDDGDEPPAMVERFRRAGLSHLTAVSGQNVALVLAAAGPLLRRLRPAGRWAVSIGLIGWFVLVTRAEPSVLRAGVMAGLGATAFVLGRQADPLRLLAVAVIGLLLVDPLLAWSVGFWLSVGATAGVVVGATHLAPRLVRLGPLALPVAVTLGAQCGVVVPSLLVFGRLSLSGTVANLLAVPVAGGVMLVGLPACLLAGALPVAAPLLMWPIGWGVWWVDAVATLAAAVEPSPPWSWLGWAALLATLIWLIRLGARGRRTPTRRS